MSLKHRWEAWQELWQRYAGSFWFYWKQRDSLQGTKLKAEEAEFLPAALSLQEKPVSPVGRTVAYILILIIIVLLLWSILGHMDVVVSASGKIIPTTYTKTVASVETGKIVAIHVKDGQTVKKGEILIELDASAPTAEQEKAVAQRQAFLLQAARSKALIEALDHQRSPVLLPIVNVDQRAWQEANRYLNAQYRDYHAKLKRLDADIKRILKTLPIIRQQAKDYKVLSKKKDVSIHAWLDKEKMLIDLEGQLTDVRYQRETLMEEVRKNAFDALNQAREQAVALKQDVLHVGSRLRLLKLRAPVDGVVHQLVVHTIGGVAPATQALLQIVPIKQKLEVEATIQNRDVGFVHVGQSAVVKVDAFEYTKYGTIPAEVIHISQDAIQDEKRGLLYTVRSTLERSSVNVNGQMLKLSPGMTVNVEIRTGTRRIIEYFLSPLLQVSQESMRER